MSHPKTFLPAVFHVNPFTFGCANKGYGKVKVIRNHQKKKIQNITSHVKPMKILTITVGTFLWCFSDKYCKTGTREHQVNNKKSFSSFAFMTGWCFFLWKSQRVFFMWKTPHNFSENPKFIWRFNLIWAFSGELGLYSE